MIIVIPSQLLCNTIYLGSIEVFHQYRDKKCYSMSQIELELDDSQSELFCERLLI